MITALSLLVGALVAAQGDAAQGDAAQGAHVDAGPVAGDGAMFSLTSVGATQAIVVVTEQWTSVIGQLKRFERVGSRWMQVGPAIEIVVGDHGLGWGLGLHPLGVGEPRKTEGDDRAPAGVFALPSAFGRGAPAFQSAMPYLQTSASLACVDDPKSARYNRIIDDVEGEVHDHQSAERLQRDDGLYDVGVLVDHNGLGDTSKPAIAGRGSCAFLHIWKKKGRGTAGCTAMARFDLETVVAWLDPKRHPVLVQLPKGELLKRRIPWQLP